MENGRTRILDEAARLFLARTAARTTLRDIADAAGVKAGSIYYHFDSKEDLLAEILDQGIERITRTVDEALVSAGPEPATRLRVAIGAHLSALFQHGPYTAAHVGVFHGAPEEVRRAGIPARDAYEERWAKLLDAAVEDPGVDLHVVRVALLGMMNSTLDWYRPDGPRGLDQVADAAFGASITAEEDGVRVRGAVVGAYPYGFANVAELGYVRVGTTLVAILGFGLALAALYWALDLALGRVSRAVVLSR